MTKKIKKLETECQEALAKLFNAKSQADKDDAGREYNRILGTIHREVARVHTRKHNNSDDMYEEGQ